LWRWCRYAPSAPRTWSRVTIDLTDHFQQRMHRFRQCVDALAPPPADEPIALALHYRVPHTPDAAAEACRAHGAFQLYASRTSHTLAADGYARVSVVFDGTDDDAGFAQLEWVVAYVRPGGVAVTEAAAAAAFVGVPCRISHLCVQYDDVARAAGATPIRVALATVGGAPAVAPRSRRAPTAADSPLVAPPPPPPPPPSPATPLLSSRTHAEPPPLALVPSGAELDQAVAPPDLDAACEAPPIKTTHPHAHRTYGADYDDEPSVYLATARDGTTYGPDVDGDTMAVVR
jgi:hypothetical protein